MIAAAFFAALWPAAASAAVVLGTLALLYKRRIDKDSSFFGLPFDVPAALFFVLAAVSIINSPDRGFSFYNYTHLAGVCALAYFLFGQGLKEVGGLKKILWALGISATLVMLYGFFQLFFGVDTGEMKWVDTEAFPGLTLRIFSTFGNPNILAGYLDAAILILFGLFRLTNNSLQKTVLATFIILLLLCLVFTYSRGALISLAVIFFVFGFFKDWKILVACFIVFGGILLADHTLVERFVSSFGTDTSSELRFALWESTVAMIQDHPFFGVGWGAYFMVYPEYDYYLQGANTLIVHAHNIYLNYAAEIGLAGMAAFVWFLFGTMKMALCADIVGEDKIVSLSLPPLGFGNIADKIRDLKPVGGDKTIETIETGETKKNIADENKSEDESEDKGESQSEDKSEDKSEEKDENQSEDKGDDKSGNADTTEEKEGGNVIALDFAKKKNKGETGETTDKGESETAEKSAEEKADKDKAEENSDEKSEDKSEEKSADNTEGDSEEKSKDKSSEDKNEDESEEKSSDKSSDKIPEKTPIEEKLSDLLEQKKNAAEEKNESEEKSEDKADNAVETKNDEKAENPNADGVRELTLSEAIAESEAAKLAKELSVDNDEKERKEADRQPKTFSDRLEEFLTWEEKQVEGGFTLGAGLALASVALNGLTDDLLFNMPTSLLTWIIAAMAAFVVADNKPITEETADEGTDDFQRDD